MAMFVACCFHRLLREYLEAAPSLSVEDAVDTLCQTGGSVLKMAHTHDGAAAACMLVAYGSPKDRKRLVRGLKGGTAGRRLTHGLANSQRWLQFWLLH